MFANEKFRSAAGLLIIASVLLLVFSPGLFFHKVLFAEDIGFLHIPYKALFFQMGQAGRISFWNSFTFSGCSNLGFGYFYPPNWLFFLMPTPQAYAWLCFFHLVLGGFLLFWYLRNLRLGFLESTAGGLLFTLSGFFLSETRHYDLFCAAVYVPGLFLCWDKRKENSAYLAIGAIFLGLQILAGAPSPQMTYISCLGLLLKMLWDLGDKANNLKEIICSGIRIFTFGILLGAVSIFTFWPLWQSTARQFIKGFNLANTYAWLPGQVLPFFAPAFFTHMEAGILDYYFGSVGLVLAVIGLLKADRRKWFWLVMALLSFWLSLGALGGMNTLLVTLIPVLKTMRTPARFLLLAIFALSVLAALGLNYLKRINHKLAWFASLLVLGELLFLSLSGLPFADANFYREPAAFTRIKKNEEKSPFPPRCLISHFEELNKSILWGFSNISGYNPLVPYYYIEYLWFMVNNRLLKPQEWYGTILHSNALVVGKWNLNMLRLLDVKYVFLRESSGYVAYSLKNPGKRFFLAGNYQVFQESAGLLSALCSPRFKPYSTVLFQKDLSFPNHQQVLGEARLVNYAPDHIELAVTNQFPNILVLSEIDFPGWQAKVNGKKVAIHRADYIFRSVLLAPGVHRIEFTYHPVGLYEGIAVSLGALLLLLGGYFWRRQRW